MTGAQFKKTIQKIKEENVLSIQFDNYSAEIFSDENKFSLATMYDDDTECCVFTLSTKNGQTLHVWIPVTEIKMINQKLDDTKHSDYDRWSLRG